MNNHIRITSLPRSLVSSSTRSWIAPLLLGLVCFLVYNANLRQIGSGDTLPARYIPLIIWHEGTLDLEDNARLVGSGHSLVNPAVRPANADQIAYFEPWAYWVTRTPQHRVASLYPIITPVLVSPLYLPAVVWLNINGWEQPQIDWVALVMEKVSASILASIASILMYLVLRREADRWTIPLVIAFAFGSNTWMISSQALWQHGAGELLIALALLLITSHPASRKCIALIGAVCVLMAANRPPDALVAAAIGLFVVWSQRRMALWFLIGSTIPLAALLYYNLNFMGHIAGGYGLIKNYPTLFQPIWSGLTGLLVSPTKGLLIFSSFLVFLPIGLIQRLRSPDSKGLAMVLSFAVIAQILLYGQADWRAGTSWGPRYLTDISPIMVWILAPAPLVLRSFARSLLIIAITVSVSIQTIGAFWYTKVSDERIYAGDPASMGGAWDLNNLPFFIELQHPPAPFELLYDAKGSLDRVGSTLVQSLGEVPVLEPGAVLEGWALTGGNSPAQLLVLIDGIVIGSTKEFSPRLDVNEVLHTDSPAGWHIIANLQGVPQGERSLQLAVRIGPRSDFRIIRDQHVLVVAQDLPTEAATMSQKPAADIELDAMAELAVSLLNQNQKEDGYWLTMHTKDLHYINPKPEMNIFTTSMLVDLLTPIAERQGLGNAVDLAQQHLTAQIESNGLVRYHGLPDGPVIGKLGCVITPDADDTALVWRIVGNAADDPRLNAMLATLAQYRDTRGFYRTWLAPRSHYQCIDPGRDPNPTDIGIQMHIYLMLRELAPPAAQNLCAALQRSFWDEDIWVYYSKAPLVPYLRSTELRQFGCTIPLPTERLVLPVDGQEIWSEVARLFVDTLTSPPDERMQQEILDLLARIGNNDFAQLRDTPPMLYHNDLSASVRRYYWSDDFGYALWLRLYEAVNSKTGSIQQSMP